MALEKTLQNKILRALERNPNVYSFKTISTNKRGVADIICCWGGRFVALEVKQEGKRATPLQQIHIDVVNSLNGVALVVDSFDKFKVVEMKLDTLVSTYNFKKVEL